jgi:hypothetical protein
VAPRAGPLRTRGCCQRRDTWIPDSTPFVEEQHSRPALLLFVPSGRERCYGRHARIQANAAGTWRSRDYRKLGAGTWIGASGGGSTGGGQLSHELARDAYAERAVQPAPARCRGRGGAARGGGRSRSPQTLALIACTLATDGLRGAADPLGDLLRRPAFACHQHDPGAISPALDLPEP